MHLVSHLPQSVASSLTNVSMGAEYSAELLIKYGLYKQKKNQTNLTLNVYGKKQKSK